MNAGLVAGLPRASFVARGVYSDQQGSVTIGDQAQPAIIPTNTVLGYQAGQNTQAQPTGQTSGSKTGTWNTYIGYQAGQSNTTGDSNTCIGYGAGQSSTTGYQNTLVGYLAAGALAATHSSVAIGASAIGSTSSVAIGYSANSGGGSNSVAIGASAIIGNVANTVVIGGGAGNASLGATNVVVGSAAASSATGANDVIIGYQAGQSDTGGTNVFIGAQAGLSNSSGTLNTFVGYLAGYTLTTANATTTATRQTLIGYNTGISTASQFNDVVCVGDSAQAFGASSVAIGSGGTRASASSVVIGYQAGNGSLGSSNIVIGQFSGIASTGLGTVLIGVNAGRSLTSGVSTMIGFGAGYSPGSGGTTANATTTATGQTLVGFQTGQGSATQRDYITCLGYETTADGAGAVAIGTDSGGAGAATSVANQIAIGTGNHTTMFAGNVAYTISTPVVTAGAVTVLANRRVSNVVVSATTAITISTTGALDGMEVTVRITDGGSGQTLSWVNTENSSASAPVISPGSATLPRTALFQYNGMTSKWRCLMNV